MAAKRRITAEDFYNMQLVTDPQVSPAGNEVIFVVSTVNQEKEYSSQLYLSDGRGRLIQFTNTSKRDYSPAWSPMGDEIAFVSTRSGLPQIWIVNRQGGEARQLTKMYHGADAPVWSPDGKKIAFLSQVGAEDEPEQLLAEKSAEVREQEQKEQGNQARVIDTLHYKSDDFGFMENKKLHLWILDVESGQVSRISKEDRNYMKPVWSPDGKKLVLNCDVDEAEYRPGEMQILLIDLKTGEEKELLPAGFTAHSPSWSPLGNRVAFYGHKLEYKGATLDRVWIVDVKDGSLQVLGNDYDLALGDYGMSDLRAGGSIPGPQWSFDGEGLYVAGSEQGNTHLYRVGLDGSVERVIDGQRQIYGFSMDVDKQKIAFVYTTPLIPGDLAVYDLATGEESRLTQLNEKLLAELELSEPEEITFEGADGWKIQGWVMKPIGFEEGHQYPLVLEIHGGPHAMYSNSFFHEFQLLAAHGYGVAYCNPRGSQGYGQEFVDAVRGDYGGKDYEDLMACTDHVAQLEWVDENRLGVTGGSYGGYMTNWIITQTQRFNAAVTQRCISNWNSFTGVSDIGYFFAEWEHKVDFMKDVQELARISPIHYVDQVETPLLLIHGEQDYRCPLEQAEQFFIHLKFLKKTAQLSIFPGSNHNLSRSGKPVLRVERLNQIANWFDQHIQG